MEPDAHYPTMWDVDFAVKNNLVDQLCAMFETVQLNCANCLRATDLKSKVYHDRTTQLVRLNILFCNFLLIRN